ncbi:MAG TPA: transferrin-binding protein-like solute binding protein [Rhizomicrobium sp.]|jgi:hypothetical protein|nr:transferrin-binding protein-like solute binding protein [Rhizomicrobium sp.]
MTLHRAAAIVALGLTVSACGGGGGGGGGIQAAAPVTPAPTTPAPTTPAPTTPAPTTPAPVTPPPVTISIVGTKSAGSGGANNATYNFTNNLPTVGTTLFLGGPSVRTTATSVTDAAIPGNDVRAIWRGTIVSNGLTFPVFDLSIASLGISATNVRGDGTLAPLTGGGEVGVVVTTLTYTMMGAWTYIEPNGAGAYLSQFSTGVLTPVASLPVSGSATYTGSGATGGVVGVYSIPGGNNTITGGTVTGNVSMNVNFATNAVTGQLTNMTAKPLGGTSVPWNNVTLTGSLDRTGGGIGGTARADAAPAGAGSTGFSTAASGSFGSSLYGPAYNEMGGTWTLSESTPDGGRAAFGAFAGKR